MPTDADAEAALERARLEAHEVACLCKRIDCDDAPCHTEADRPRSEFHCRCCSPSVQRPCADIGHTRIAALESAARLAQAEVDLDLAAAAPMDFRLTVLKEERDRLLREAKETT